ncbi:aspartate aminotransferase family protein [Brucella tritici]|uniref:Aspartate aminotransferase family protein n=1 Tax=Brucella tritici TaxID=94626 RepID=A0A6L3YN39_9HYPH|nr:aspartate aminotransferase family protein [Brucella tritici]KAB2684361.1 aspartate aminotransferase family protein [Brucella tritici]
MSDHLLPIFNRDSLSFEFGKGSWLYTALGERYLDFSSGIAVTALGHNHPHLVKSVRVQLNKLWHTSNLFRIPSGELLAARLASEGFADVVFFCNSGGEANEAAVKIARRFQASSGQPNRYRIISFRGAFHGRSLAMIAATGHEPYLEGFGPKADGFDQVSLGDWDALTKVISAETAAIMLEPVQGEGGLLVVDPVTLRRLRSICDEHGLLLILDEIQSGMGRTGKLFAYQWSGITPDIMTLAKGLGGGFPIGACLATRRASKGMLRGSHGTTFGGNPLAMAAGNAVLDIVLDPAFLPRAARMGEFLRARLERIVQRYPHLFLGRVGIGLLQGLRLRDEPNRFMDALIAERLLAVPARGNVVRFVPPLTVSQAEITVACEKISAACSHIDTRKCLNKQLAEATPKSPARTQTTAGQRL